MTEEASPRKYSLRKKAVFLNDFKNACICCICSEEVSKENIIGLSCNPEKHIFCKECITDWYSEIKKKKYMNSNYDKQRMCPVCRQDGGLLPISEQIGFIRGIHYLLPMKKMKVSKEESLSEKNPNEEIINNNNSEKKYCNHPLKKKNCFCKNTAKDIYGGSCRLHYKPTNAI